MKKYITDYSNRYPEGKQVYIVNHCFDDVKDPKVLTLSKQHRLLRLLTQGVRLTDASEKIEVDIELCKIFLDTRERDSSRRKDMVRKGVCVPVIAINVVTGEEMLFKSIKEASLFLDRATGTIRKYIETGEEINGYKLKINE